MIVFLAAWLLPPFWGIATLRTINIQDDIYTSDLLNDRLPTRAFVGRTIAAGELPTWMPGVYTGFPALAAVETGALYPTNWLLFGLLEPYAAIAYAQLLPLFLAGLGTFLLAREWGLPVAASLLAAGSFSLSGFFVSHLRQLNMVDAACWLPLVFLLVERIVRGRPRAGASLAVVWTLQILAGHPQISYFTALGTVPFLIVRWRQIDRETLPSPAGVWPVRFARGPAIRSFVLAIATGALLAGAQLVPGIELASTSHRGGGFSFAEASAYPASPRNAWTFLLPYVNGDPGRDTYHLSGIFWEQYGYLGVAPALLALLACVAGWRNPKIRLLGGLALVSYVLTLGGSSFVFFLAHRFVPGMDFFRFPTRFLVFVELSLALLSAFGLTIVLGRLRSRRLRGAVAVAVLAGTAADLWFHQLRQIPQVEWSTWTSAVPTARYLEAKTGEADQPWRYYSLDSTMVHAATFHGAGGWSGDLGPYVRLRSMLQPSFNLLHGLDSPDGYVNLAPRAYEAVWGSDKEPGLVRPSGEVRDGAWHLNPEVGRLLRLFNVRYVISAYPVESEDLRKPIVFPEAVGIQEVRDPLPRAFVVGRVRLAESDAEALEILRSPGFDPAREAIVHDGAAALPADVAPAQDVRIAARTNTAVTVEIALAHPGLLVLSEGYYPGWRAMLDGREVPIRRANLMMRAVDVPAGEHRVEFVFRPASVRIGFGISAVGLVCLGLLLIRARRDQ